METINPMGNNEMFEIKKQNELQRVGKERNIHRTQQEIDKCKMNLVMRDDAIANHENMIAVLESHVKEGWRAKCPDCKAILIDYTDKELKATKENEIRDRKTNIERLKIEKEWIKKDLEFFSKELEISKKYLNTTL